MADSRARHPQHDLELVAALAAGEASGAELDRAEHLLDACDLCVGVARDLRRITLALQAMRAGGEMATLPAAPRDFRLTQEQAARLRPSAPLGIRSGASRPGWTSRLAATMTAFGRPVGASLATFGLVGLLVGAATLGSLGGTFELAPVTADAKASPAAGAGEIGAAGAQPAAATASNGTTAFGPAATPSDRQAGGEPPHVTDAAPSGVNASVCQYCGSIMRLGIRTTPHP